MWKTNQPNTTKSFGMGKISPVHVALIVYQYLNDNNFFSNALSCCTFVFFSPDFNQFYVIPKQKLGGATAEIMSDLLAFEADRRAVNITINRYI